MPLKSFSTAPVSTCTSACDGRYRAQHQEQNSETLQCSFLFFWTCWMTLRWQDYPRQALKRLPISNCSGKNKGEYSIMKVTLTVQRGRQRGHCVGIKGSAWIEVYGRKMWPALPLKTACFRDFRVYCTRCKLIACLSEVLLWHETVSLKILRWYCVCQIQQLACTFQHDRSMVATLYYRQIHFIYKLHSCMQISLEL